MTNEDLDRLIELAKKATPGPWQLDAWDVGDGDHYNLPQIIGDNWISKEDGEYVSAMSPDVCIALCEELKAYRKREEFTTLARYAEPLILTHEPVSDDDE